jgi:hypothetical protein
MKHFYLVCKLIRHYYFCMFDGTHFVFEDVIERSWHSADQIEEEDPKSERNVVGALQRRHLTQNHERVPHCVAESSRHHCLEQKISRRFYFSYRWRSTKLKFDDKFFLRNNKSPTLHRHQKIIQRSDSQRPLWRERQIKFFFLNFFHQLLFLLYRTYKKR